MNASTSHRKVYSILHLYINLSFFFANLADAWQNIDSFEAQTVQLLALILLSFIHKLDLFMNKNGCSYNLYLLQRVVRNDHRCSNT